MGNTTYLNNNNNKILCNGCGACEKICPVNAISMIEDNEGFLYPKIDEEKCINCKKCRVVCSNFPKHNDYKIRAFAAKNKDNDKRMKSTSGGMFKAFAEFVIDNNGVVFGAKINNDFEVKHDYSETIEDCQKFSESKYVRSDLNKSYEKVKEFLEKGRYVLFSGTPCQCYGLRNFLGKDYEKLLLCEILCLANPSPKIFKMYIKNMEIKQNKKVNKMFFRSKNPEMNNEAYVEFCDGSKISASTYIKAFVKEKLISRPSCNNCQFVDENRKADFTIGDFWGIDKVFPGFDDKKGISLLTVNTEKANNIFEQVKDKIDYKETDVITAFSGNHYTNRPASKNREKFFNGIISGKINENNIIDYLEKYCIY